MAEITDPALLAELGRGAPSAPGGGMVLRKPSDPFKAADDRRAEDANRRAEEAARLAREAANKPPSGFSWSADGKSLIPIPGGPSDPNADPKTGSRQEKANVILGMLDNLQGLYDSDIKGQPASRLFGLTERVDMIPANERFRSAGMNLLPLIRPLVAQSAKEGDSDKEMEIFLSYIPSNDDNDITIESKMRMLRALVGGVVEGKSPSEIEGIASGRGMAAGAGPLGPVGNSSDGVDRSSRLMGGAETEGVTLARKGQRFATENDKRLHTLIQTMLDNGASAAEANATAEGLGYKPEGRRPIFDAKEWATAQRYNATVRDGQPRATVTTPETGVSDPTFLNRAAGGDIGAGVGGYLNGISAGFLDEGVGAIDSLFSGRPLDEAIAEADFKKGLSAANSPKANFLGNAAGGLTGALTGGALLGRVAPGIAQATRAGGVFSPGAVGADLAYGGLFGAGESNDNRMGGAATGVALAGPAGMLGRTAGKGLIAASRTAPAQKLSDTIRRVGGLDPRLAPPRPGAADRAAFGALNKAGADDVTAQLREADGLGVPMTLADTHPELRSLAGASVRRSPTASLHAENTLIPRSRGQISRLGKYVERDLGPTANLPQASKALLDKARTDAKPLYEAAFNSPGASSVNVSGMLQTPAGQSALRRAYDVMRNRQMDPTALGFELNEAGEVMLNRVPSFEALDIVKRELDDAISSAPFDPVTRQQTFSPAQRDAIQLRNELVGEMDRVNPDYKAARAAYAGPASEREALRLGKQSVNQNPDVVGATYGGLTPSRQKQFGLGFRSGMMDNAERVRFSGNPFEATLGSPAQQETVGALFPQGAPNLLRSYDIERNLANTSNDILGNSKTAQRVLADQEFGAGDLAQTALDVGVNLATGQVPTSLLLKQGAGTAIKDWWKLGIGKGARAKAEGLAPVLLDTSPRANIDTITRLTQESEAFNQFMADQRRRLARPAGMLGSVAAAQNAPF